MRLLAPAKINLHLRVGPRREDGFHPLLSWMCTVGLFDTLTLTTQPAGGAGDIELSCDRADLPCDQSNLVLKVTHGLAQALAADDASGGAKRPAVAARLVKRIPMGAGLGGGSSDGARMLMGLNRLWQVGWTAGKLAQLAARFGSDLPFFFFGPNSVCAGRGEIVRPIEAPRAKWAVIVMPATLAMPTPAVYRRFDELRLGEAAAVREEPDWKRWATLGAQSLLAELVNDLEPAAFAISPELGQLRAEVEQVAGRIVRMSGSGSSLFTLFDDEPAAKDAAQRIEARQRVSAVAVPLAPRIEDDLG